MEKSSPGSWFCTISCSAMANTPTTSTSTATKRFSICESFDISSTLSENMCNVNDNMCISMYIYILFITDTYCDRSKYGNVSKDLEKHCSFNVSKLGTEHSSGGEGWFRQIRLGAGLSGEHKPNMRRKRWTGQRCQPRYWSLERFLGESFSNTDLRCHSKEDPREICLLYPLVMTNILKMTIYSGFTH